MSWYLVALQVAHHEASIAATHFQEALPHIFHRAYHVGNVFSKHAQVGTDFGR